MRVGRSLMTAAHHGRPLVVRGSLPRTFLGIGIFAEVGLLFAGVYLLSEALRRPLEAQQGAVISAGVLLSLATVLLFYLCAQNGLKHSPKKMVRTVRRGNWNPR